MPEQDPVPEADAQEQATPVVPDEETETEEALAPVLTKDPFVAEVPEADALEQAQPAELDDEERD